MPVRHLSAAVRRPAGDVYRFASDPLNLPRWAAGLSGSIDHNGVEWIADSPMGPVAVRFVEENSLGVLDHWVRTEEGQVFFNAMRVIPRDEETCEVLFTLFQREDMSVDEFDADSEMVRRDLAALKQLMEGV